MSEIRALKKAAKEVSAFMKALQSSLSFHEERVKKYQNVMDRYFDNCDLNKSVEQSKQSLFRFKLDQFTPQINGSADYSFYILETVSFPPLKVRYTLKVLKDINHTSKKKTLKLNLELVNLRPYQDDVGKHLLGLYGSVRKAKTKLGTQIKNTIIISWDTSEEDIFIQLLLLAVKHSFILDSHESFRCFLAYTRRLKNMPSINDSKLKDEIASIAFSHVVRCYGFPIEEYSFKKYISLVVYGIMRARRVPKLRAVQSYAWKKEAEEDDPAGESKDARINIYDFQIFEDAEGRITYGIDRVAMDTGISRDTIYRHIRQKKIIPRFFPFGARNYLTLDNEVINKLKNQIVVRKALVKLISQKRAITEDSARKRILRLRSKGLSLNQIYTLDR